MEMEMDFKKVITSMLMALGVLIWYAHAMESGNNQYVTLTTSDGERVQIALASARVFDRINDVIKDLGVPTDEIPVFISKNMLDRITASLNYLQTVYPNAMTPADISSRPLENRRQEAERAARDLPVQSFDLQVLKEAVDDYSAAHYLGVPELEERCARVIADITLSDESMKLLQERRNTYTDFVSTLVTNRSKEGNDSGLIQHVLRYIRLKTQFTLLWNTKSAIQHRSSINSAHFSRDGNRILTASMDNTARLWVLNNDADEGFIGWRQEALFEHEASVSSAEFSPNEESIVTASRDNSCKIFMRQNGQWVKDGEYLHNSSVLAAHFAHTTNTKIVTASDDNTAAILEKVGNNWMASNTLNNSYPVTKAEISFDGTRILTGTENGYFSLWGQDANGNMLSSRHKHTDNLKALAFSPDNIRLLTAGDDNAYVWVWTNNGLANELKVTHNALINTAKFSPSGNRLVTTYSDSAVKIHALRNNRWQQETSFSLGRDAGRVTNAAFSLDGNKLVFGTSNGLVKVYQMINGTWREIGLYTLGWAISTIEFAPDNANVLVSYSSTATVLSPINLNRFDKVLFIEMLRWANRSPDDRRIDLQGWQRLAYDMFSTEEKTAIKTAYPRLFRRR